IVSYNAAQGSGHLPQNLISSLKPKFAVDCSEAAQVQHNDAELFLVAARSLNLLPDGVMKIPLVVNPGKRVKVREAAQFFRQLHVARCRGTDISGGLRNGTVVGCKERCLGVSQNNRT